MSAQARQSVRCQARLLPSVQRRWFAIALLVLASLPNALAANSSRLVQGTVIGVREQEVHSLNFMTGGSDPSDAPLASRYYAFEIAIRVDCSTYVGRYETVLNYLPPALAAGQSISMRLTKHAMYFDLSQDPELKIGIVRRKAACPPCSNRTECGDYRQRD